MQFAIIETGGKQLIIKNGDRIFVEKINSNVGDTYIFKNVLLVFDKENNDIIIGKPYIKNCSVKANVLKHGKAEKIIVYKFKAKHNERKTIGHRQHFTELEVKEIVCENDNKNDKNKE